MGEEVKMRELEDQVNLEEEEEEEEEEEDGEEEEEDGEGIYGGGGGEEERVIEWEMGLPNADDLTPLSQLLIPPELASAFSISPEPYRTVRDVNRASHTTFSSLRGGGGGVGGQQGNALSSTDPMGVDLRDVGGGGGGGGGDGSGGSGGSGSKSKRIGSEEADSAVVMAAGGGGAGAVDDSMIDGDDPSSARTLKRPRLVWTPQLHKRFVDVVGHLGIKNAVPKTIMQLMNVEGLTRENVASHLQKYRLYLKRMQGLSSTTSNDGASTASENNTINNSSNHNNHIFPPSASTAPENGNMGMPYHHHPHPHHPHPHHQHPGMMPMPVYGHMGMQHQQMMNGFDGGFQYAGYGSVMSHHHHHHQRIGSNDNM